ncbi:MAG: helix-turn-helix domain-containing protein [Bacillota bacterium]
MDNVEALHHPVIKLALSPDEAAEALGVSKRTIYEMVNRKQLHHRRIKARGKKGLGKIIIPLAALEKWLAEEERPAAQVKPKKKSLAR